MVFMNQISNSNGEREKIYELLIDKFIGFSIITIENQKQQKQNEKKKNIYLNIIMEIGLCI